MPTMPVAIPLTPRPKRIRRRVTFLAGAYRASQTVAQGRTPQGGWLFRAVGLGNRFYMMRSIARGCAAGAVGTTALKVVTYGDMALRGRPPSTIPEQVVDELSARLGHPVGGPGEERDNRLSGLGALCGIAVGCGVGSAVSLARRVGVRMPVWLGGALTGAFAMVVTGLPIARLQISDPRSWSTEDWLSDAIPHVAYGMVTYGVIASGDKPRQRP